MLQPCGPEKWQHHEEVYKTRTTISIQNGTNVSWGKWPKALVMCNTVVTINSWLRGIIFGMQIIRHLVFPCSKPLQYCSTAFRLPTFFSYHNHKMTKNDWLGGQSCRFPLCSTFSALQFLLLQSPREFYLCNQFVHSQHWHKCAALGAAYITGEMG